MAEGSSRSGRSTVLWLGLLVLLAFSVRFFFSNGSGFDDDSDRYLLTGNDPYYHHRTVEHILEKGEHLSFDPAINYPAGAYNPNPPMYAWSAVPLAAVLQDSGASDPVGLSLNIMVAVWGALTVLPVYSIAKDLWSRRAGLWAAVLMAASAPHIERSVAGYADHDATTMFFITLAFACMVKGLLALQQKQYVTRWNGPARSLELRTAIRENATALRWSALAGLALTATALTWKGYPYALAVMAVGLTLQLVLDHLRHRDATAVYLVYLVPMAIVSVLPYLLYYVHFPTFQDTTVIPSLFVLLGVVAVGLFFVPTRNLPPTLVIPAALLTAVVGLVLVRVFLPDQFATIFTGLGYFQQSKLYSTIAEAQRPDIGTVAAAFGFFTFLMVFWGIGRVLRGAFKGNAALTLVSAWALVALFMAFAASRFIMNAAPVFMILIGTTMVTLVSLAGLDAIGRKMRDRSSQGMGAMAGTLTWRSVLGGLLIFLLLVVPNVWAGFDAGTSYSFERDHDLQSNEFFGAYGVAYELQGQGWRQTMLELASHDTCRSSDAVCQPGDADYRPLEERPAFLAWWDYGHWAVGIGRHPTVADPFQHHYAVSGRILASASEQEAVAHLLILLLNDDYHNVGGGAHTAAVASAIAPFPGLEQVGPTTGAGAELTVLNNTVGLEGEDVFRAYDAVMAATGKSVRYLGVDDKMYPSGVGASGIFYAPVFLANKDPEDYVRTVFPTQTGMTVELQQYDVDENGDSYRLSRDRYVGSDGKEYEPVNGAFFPKGHTPLQGVDPANGIRFDSPRLDTTDKFDESMYARAFGGPYTFSTKTKAGQQVGDAPGEGLTHWRAIQESTTRFTPQQRDQAQVGDGAAFRHTVLLEYYTGVTVTGKVLDDTGQPMAGAQVSFVDGFGAGHGTNVTAADGSYSVRAPFSVDGDLTLAVRLGTDVLAEEKGAELQFTRAQAAAGGTVPGPTITVQRGTIDGLVYEDTDGDGQYNASKDEELQGVAVAVGSRSGATGADGRFDLGRFQAGGYSLNATKAQYETQTRPVTVRPGEGSDLRLALKPTPASLVVNVTEEGSTAPPVGVPVMLVQGNATKQTGTTNATGVARMAGVGPGEYTVKVDHKFTDTGGQEFVYSATQPLTVPRGGGEVRLTLVLQKNAT